MKKQTKYVAVLSAAALLAMGASMTSFAAGWEKDEAGAWHYYDKDDDMVTNEWKKDGGKWFYLDDDGNMATNRWVDDESYVGEDGAMITNGWIKTLADDEELDDPSEDGEHWYYFNAKGKKVTGKKTIAGKTYYFDPEGKMRSGWYQDSNGNVYYLGDEDDGAMAKNRWLWLEKAGNAYDEDDPDSVRNSQVTFTNGGVKTTCEEDDNCDDEGWYWFDASGKMCHQEGVKTINGRKFIFGEHGQMLYEWINNTKVTGSSNSQLDSNLDDASTGEVSIANMLWFQENGDGATNGARVDGWQYISGSKGTDTEGDTNWYFIKKGKAKYATEGTVEDADTYETIAADKKKDWNGLRDGGDPVYRMKEKLSWSGKTGTFCFDQKGKMKTGLQLIGGKTYYFDGDGYMKTGKISGVEEEGGDTYTYYFTTKNANKGQGLTGVKDGYLYFMGKRLEADDDFRLYRVNNRTYLVNKNGKLQKSCNNKNIELPEGGVEEKVDLDFADSKNYVIKDSSVVYTDDNDKEVTAKDIAVLPHIQLEDTDNYIIGTEAGELKICSKAETDLLEDLNNLITVKTAEGNVDLK